MIDNKRFFPLLPFKIIISNLVPRVLSYSCLGVGEDPGNKIVVISN